MLTTETRGNRQKPPTGTNKPPNARRTSNFVTDFDANDTREEDQEKVMDRVSPHVACCLCCSGSRKLASCPELQKEPICKRHRLCHLCFKPGLHRGRCEFQKLLHNVSSLAGKERQAFEIRTKFRVVLT